jgi:GR25 family glycosyltransferase involved in LPS biosynthesis
MHIEVRYMVIVIIAAMMIYVALWRIYVLQPSFSFKEYSKKLSFKKTPKNLNSTLGFDHIYVINSLSQINRREKMQDVARKLDLEFDFFLALTPENSKPTLDKFNPKSKLNPSHKAFYINHYKVYESIVNHGYDNALILEDDIDFEFNITSIMHNVRRILPSNWDLLYLSFCNGWEGVFSDPLPNNGPSYYKLFKSKKPYCAHAYAVSSSGVVKLLRRLIPTTLPIDFELINMIQSEQISSYTIVPPPIVQLRAPSNGNYGLYHLKNSTVNLLTEKSRPFSSTLGFSHIYVANGSNRQERRKKLKAMANKLDLELEFFSPDAPHKLPKKFNLGDGLGPIQKAYYISHDKIYRSIAHHGYDSALILEDDVDLELNIKSIMTDTHRILPADWEILYLGHCSDLEGRSGHSLSSSSSYKLFKSKKPYCTHAYAISYVGALKILQELAKQTNLPIDIELVHMVEQGALTSYTLIPPVASQWHVSSDNYPGKKNFDFFQLKDSTLQSLGFDLRKSNSTLGFSHIYVINLLSRPDRREKLEIVANKFNLSLEFFPAVSKYDTEILNEFNFDADMIPTHKACYASHYKTYQSIIQHGYDSALILEDDVDFELNIASIVTDAHRILPSNWEMFYLGFCSNFEGNEVKPLPDEDNIASDYQIFKSVSPYCTHAYAVSHAGALKLIKNLAKPSGAPIDLELISLIGRGAINSYTIVPPVILQWRSFSNPSDISPGAENFDFYFLKNSAMHFLGVIKETNSTLGFNHIYVINHSDQTERLDTIATRLLLDIEFFDSQSDETFEEFNAMQQSQYANWISHYEVYQSIIDNEYSSALILEDNIDIEVNIASIMSDVHRILPADWEILYLGHCNNLEGKSNERLIDNNNDELTTYKLFKSERPRCTHAYAVSNAGALRLLEKLGNPTLLPIGLELSNMIQLGEIISYSLIPPTIVRLRSDGQTFDFYTLKNSTAEFLKIGM